MMTTSDSTVTSRGIANKLNGTTTHPTAHPTTRGSFEWHSQEYDRFAAALVVERNELASRRASGEQCSHNNIRECSRLMLMHLRAMYTLRVRGY